MNKVPSFDEFIQKRQNLIKKVSNKDQQSINTIDDDADDDVINNDDEDLDAEGSKYTKKEDLDTTPIKKVPSSDDEDDDKDDEDTNTGEKEESTAII